jgi:dynein heavy chain
MQLFARRVTKMHSLFSTIADFDEMFQHNLEGISEVTSTYRQICIEIAAKRHDLFAYRNYAFDRDFVEFNVRINELEAKLLDFIKQSFSTITSIAQSLELLQKFRSVFQRPSLQRDLRIRLDVIFQSYGAELERVQSLYEEFKHSPPRARNMPPVAGNIRWARHLFSRVEQPMMEFSQHQELLNTKIGRRIVKLYNRIARTLVAYEYLWLQAWVDSVDKAKTGLQATLIIRHPEDGQLYVNFDKEILQLIREAKCLQRMGISIPESAQAVVVQESKFKSYYSNLRYILAEYKRNADTIIHATHGVLQSPLNDLEYRLRPGMVSLTWTSMNIDAYKLHVQNGLQRLNRLIVTINDIIENRIEKNMKRIAKSSLVTLPDDRTVTLSEFVQLQQQHIAQVAKSLQNLNLSVEAAVQDLVQLLHSYELDPHIPAVSEKECIGLSTHYNHYLYAALLTSIKNSLNALKQRLAHRQTSTFLFVQRPFFEVDIQLSVPQVILKPSILQVQDAINQAAREILGCAERMYDWGESHKPENERKTFFRRITKDIEIVRVVLLLTGSIQGTRTQVGSYLETFREYRWLWEKDADEEYAKFLSSKPTIDDYEMELARFLGIQQNIEGISVVYNIGALTLKTKNVKSQLKNEVQAWMRRYSEKLHKLAREKLQDMTEYMKTATSMLDKKVNSLTSLRYVMDVLHGVRTRQASIDM